MSETKPEIPPAMLDAAAEALLKSSYGFNKAAARSVAGIALEAVGVPSMTARIAEQEAELAKFQTSKFHPDWSLLEAAQENLREAWTRIRELEADRNRLRWIKDGSGIDGFYGVIDDRYDLALAVARERGHDEPTEDDEFDGWRRLIDLAMKCAEGAGGE